MVVWWSFKDFLGPGWEMEWVGMIQMPWSYTTHTFCLASGTLLRKKCLCMLDLLFTFLLVSTWEYCQKQGVMLAGLSKAQYYYLCLKAFSSALFEGEKVAWREREATWMSQCKGCKYAAKEPCTTTWCPLSITTKLLIRSMQTSVTSSQSMLT